MATFTQVGKSTRAQICVKGIRESKTFETKGAARAWAIRREDEIKAGHIIPDRTFGELLDRYARDVSVNKKGFRWELVRIEAIKRSTIGKVRLRDLDQTHVAQWRDERLKTVSGSTVVREKNLLCHACTIAIDEWRWLQKNPFSKVRMPKESKPRNRLMTDDERKTLEDFALTEIYKEVLRMADFAVETGMRASEICGLSQVIGKVAILEDTKNGDRREVPLSDKALEIWNQGKFKLTPQLLDVHWRNLCKSAGIVDLRFHDLRHLAATRLSKKLNLLQLCKMFGWRDPKHAMVYFNETAEDISKKL